jgi:hypothetical protein
VAGIKRNRWPICSGIGGRNGAEYALIESLIDAGLRFDIKWINEALELVGESLKLD